MIPQKGRDLRASGPENVNTIWWNLSTPALDEHALQRRDGILRYLGPPVLRTGQSTALIDIAIASAAPAHTAHRLPTSVIC